MHTYVLQIIYTDVYIKCMYRHIWPAAQIIYLCIKLHCFSRKEKKKMIFKTNIKILSYMPK